VLEYGLIAANAMHALPRHEFADHKSMSQAEPMRSAAFSLPLFAVRAACAANKPTTP